MAARALRCASLSYLPIALVTSWLTSCNGLPSCSSSTARKRLVPLQLSLFESIGTEGRRGSFQITSPMWTQPQRSPGQNCPGPEYETDRPRSRRTTYSPGSRSSFVIHGSDNITIAQTRDALPLVNVLGRPALRPRHVPLHYNECCRDEDIKGNLVSYD
jgi:hypothetical protein